MRNLLQLFILSCLLFSSAAFAVKVDSIYQADIPVASQSVEDRAKGAQKGLAEVLVKVSGNSQILANEKIKSHLKDAETFVTEFSYASSATPIIYIMTLHFDPESVNKLLQDAGVPIWGVNRPLILAWIETEVPNHPAEIVSNDAITDFATLFKTHAKQRGLPIILPMMDVTDMNQVSIKDIVTMNFAPLQNASKRYSSDAILVVREMQEVNGFALEAKMMMGNDQWNFNIKSSSLMDAISQLMDKITNTLSPRYSTVISKNVQGKLIIKVKNIKQGSDYMQLVNYLKHLTPVAKVQTVQVTGDEVILDISLHGSRDAFTQVISIGQNLKPVAAAPGETLSVYEWNP